MKIKFFATFRDITGETHREWPAQPSTVRELLEQLLDRYGEPFGRMTFAANGTLSAGVLVLVNGQNVLDLRGLQTPLESKDVVSLFPPVAGG